MNDLSAPVVHSAAAKLRGQVVPTPVIGGVHLAGDGEVDLRWKAELIQTGGSGWYRGYLHLLLKSYGALPGVSFCGPVAQVLAAAVAAYHHRLSMHVFSSVPLLDDVNEALASLKATVEVDRASIPPPVPPAVLLSIELLDTVRKLLCTTSPPP